MAIITTDIVSEYGNYYIAGGQNEQRLRQLMQYGFESRSFFTPMPTDDSVYQMGSSSIGELLQAFQKTFTPKGDTEFKPQPIQTYKQKIDAEEYPDDLERTWLAFLGSNKLDRGEWPFVRWWIEKHLVGQTYSDLELEAIYSGVYAAPSTGVAGAAKNAMTGFKRIINQWRFDGVIPGTNVINTGAFDTASPSNFVGQIIAFTKSVNALYRNRIPMKLAVGNEFEMHWNQGVLEKYNLNNTTMPDGNKNRVPFANNIELAFLPSIGSSEKLVLTPAANAIMPQKGMENLGKFKVEASKRQVSAYTDFQFGVGFVLPTEIWTNDRDISLS